MKRLLNSDFVVGFHYAKNEWGLGVTLYRFPSPGEKTAWSCMISVGPFHGEVEYDPNP